MKTILAILLQLSTLLYESFAQQVFQVSDSPYFPSTSVYGSLKGGAVLYIRGAGFDMMHDNQVLVGSFPCVVNEYFTTESFLTCQMPQQSFGDTDITLYVSVYIMGNSYTCSTSSKCAVNLRYDRSPNLKAVIPQATVAGTNVTLIGYFFSSSTDKIKEIRIGGYNCIVPEEMSKNLDSYNQYSSFQCYAPPDIAPNDYKMTVTASEGTGLSNAYVSSMSFKVGDSQTSFNLRIHPALQGISSHQGYVDGQIVTLLGNGFGNDPSKISISYKDMTCKVLAVLNDQIKCELQADPGNPLSATYIGGAGLEYRFYSLSLSPNSLRSRPNYPDNDSPVINVTLTTENYLDLSSYSQRMSGLFYAPVDGQYTFYISSDDQSSLRMSSTPYDPTVTYNESTLTQICSVALWTSFRSFYQYSTQRCTVTLQGSKYYYILALMNENGGGDHLSIGVSIPNNDPTLPNTKPAIKKIYVQNTPVREVVSYQISKAISGTYKILFYAKDAGNKVILNISTGNIAYNADAATVSNAIRAVTGYDIAVVRVGLDSNNLETSVDADTVAYNYTITFNSYRSPQALPFLIITNLYGNIVWSANQITPPSPPIQGNFAIQVGSYKSAPISAHIDRISLQTLLSKIPTLSKGVSVTEFGNNNDGKTWYIRLDSLKDNPDFTIVDNLVTGGPVDSPAQLLIDNSFELPSNDLYYMPIPSDLLYTFSSSPEFRVKVGDLYAACITRDCAYNVLPSSDSPVIESFLFSEPILTITLNSGYSSLPDVSLIVQENLSITFSKSPCTITSVSLPTITCSMPTNSDSSANITAGSFVPKIHLMNRGYFASTASPQQFSLNVNDVSPSTGSIGGGTEIILTGQGFSSDTRVEINGGNCQIISVSNIQINCITPAMNSTAPATTIVVTEETESITLSNLFTYSSASTPTITSLSKSSSSPVLKSSLDITADNLGTDIAELDVKLIGNKKDGTPVELPCTPFSITGNVLKCVLGGGPVGDYRVVINRTTFGNSIADPVDANKFSYLISVSSVSPTIGSKAGGQIITITGTNFSTIKNQNQVVINEIMCQIVSATPTELQAIVPPLPSDSNTSTFTIYVVGRIVEYADCDPSVCTYTYNDNMTPTITDMSPTSGVAGTSVTITGTLLNDPAIKIMLGNVQIFGIVSQSDSSITFLIPATASFRGSLSVFSPLMGYALLANNFIFENQFQVTASSPSSGSMGGNMIQISGNGFNTTNVSVKIGTSNVCNILSASFSSITCWFENLSATSTNYNVVVSQNGISANCPTCVYTTLDNASTPYINSISTTTFNTPDSISFTISGTNLGDGSDTVALLISRSNPKSIFSGSISYPSNILTLTFTNLPIGTYKLAYYISSLGFAKINAATADISVVPLASSFTSTPTQVSYVGGPSFTITGSGFLNLIDLSSDTVKVCNYKAQVTSSSYNSLTFTIPQLVTAASNQLFNLVKDGQINPQVITSSDNSAAAANPNDGNFSSYFSSTSNSCWVKYDYGADFTAQISKIQMFPYIGASVTTLIGATIQGSNDDVNWTTLITIPKEVVLNWNSYFPPTDQPNLWQYRYVRFYGNKCQVAEFNLFGIVVHSGGDGTSEMCDVVIKMGGQSMTLTNQIEYRADQTPSVSSISPTMGSTAGGTVLTITGSGFVPATSTVMIDGVDCPINQGLSTATTLTCTTGARPNFVPPKIVISTANGLASIGTSSFLYIDRWSDIATWSGESFPREGDSVYVPIGQNLLIDVSPPRIYAMIVEGSIVWDDTQNLEFHADFITVRGGTLQIGTEENPHQHKLTITLYGNKESKQLPVTGNKNIAVHSGKIDIHGAPKTPSWTLLDSSVAAGVSTITLKESVNWSVGDEIVVASTSFNRNEFERRFITDISPDSMTLTLDNPLNFAHFAETLSYNGNTYEVRAEVAVLTRNVRVVGDPTTDQTQYGAHIMMMGRDSGLIGRFSNLEMTRCGQAFMMARYPIHFHMAGNVIGSYVKNCSIHDSNNRGTTIHGVHFLQLMNNVYLNHMGHGIFIEDSVESNNVIEGNLVMRTRTSASLLASDLKPASFWITRPKNFIRYNHAAGSTHFGFWFDLPGNPTGPSATTTICPSGEPLGQFHHNVAHTNGIGLRIYPIYIPRTNPCGSVSNPNISDPFSDNPSVVAEFTDNLLFGNSEGFFGRNLGAIQLIRTAFISNMMNAVVAEPDSTNFFVPRIEDSIFVGKVNSWHALQGVQSAGAFGTGRRDGFYLHNVEFIDFPTGSSIFVTCEGCGDELHRDIGARQTRFENLKFTNVNARMIQYNDAQRDKDIFEDIDGSLIRQFGVASSTGGWIVPYFKYLDVPECSTIITDTNICSEKCMICDNTVKLRRVVLQIPDSKFDGLDLKVLNYDINSDMTVADNFQIVKFRSVTVQNFKGWVLPFASSYGYNIHWTTGLDFTTLNIKNNRLYESADPGFFLRTNNTYQRELYDGAFSGLNSGVYTSYLNVTSLSADPTTANYFSDFYYTNSTNTSVIRVDGNRIGTFAFTGVYCRFYCPVEPIPGEIEANFRLWSNPASWQNNAIPIAGDLVVIEDTWNMLLDVNTPLLNKLTIKGRLTFGTNLNSMTLNSKNIEITNGGELIIGNSTTPYDKQATILLEGDRTDPQIIIDPIITPATKALVVKGNLQVYGLAKTPVTTRLQQSALRGTTTIYLTEDTNWAVGDELVIAASSRNPTDVDYVQILTKISGNTFIVTPPLLYDHYGASTPITTPGLRILDMRAEVSVINRNVVIKGKNNNNWGCRILIPGFEDLTYDPPLSVEGKIDLNYAEVNYCGQKDSDQAAIDFQGAQNNDQRVIGCSVRNGIAWGINIQNSNNILIDNNIITNQTKTGVHVKNAQNITFQNNTVTLINNRTDYSNVEFLDLIIGFYYNTAGTLKQNNVTVRNNIISSTSWFSWAVPGYDCNDDDSYFYNNTGHSSRAGWFGLVTNGECMKFSDFTGYWNWDEGFSQRFLVKNLIVTRMLVADNNNSISINGGDPQDSKYPQVTFSESEVFGQVLLQDCSFCYQTPDSCQSSGLFTSLFETTNFVMEFEANRLPLHNVTSTDFLWGGHHDVINVNFTDFRTTDVCSHSFAIRANNFIQDTSAYVKLVDVIFDNVDYNNVIFFYNHTRTKNPGFCSKRDCTGIYNLIVADTTGGIFGSPKTFFGFNKPAGRDGNCTFEPVWNGHVCNPVYSLLSMLNPAATRQIIITPITVTIYNGTTDGLSSDLQFSNTVDNELKIPIIVKKFGYHNINIQGPFPNDAMYKLDSESPTDWAIFRLQNTDVSTMITLVNNVRMNPQIVDANGAFDFSNAGCGDYVYFPGNRTIIFKITAEPTCLVRVQIIASLQLSLHINIAPLQFFANGGTTTFLDRMAALLGISIDRIRIVGIFNGSTIVNVLILPPADSIPTNVNEQQAQLQELKTVQQTFSGAVADGTTNLGGYLLGASSSLTTAPPLGSGGPDPNTIKVSPSSICSS